MDFRMAVGKREPASLIVFCQSDAIPRGVSRVEMTRVWRD
jgi:hypothetical protein